MSGERIPVWADWTEILGAQLPQIESTYDFVKRSDIEAVVDERLAEKLPDLCAKCEDCTYGYRTSRACDKGAIFGMPCMDFRSREADRRAAANAVFGREWRNRLGATPPGHGMNETPPDALRTAARELDFRITDALEKGWAKDTFEDVMYDIDAGIGESLAKVRALLEV